MVTERKFYRTVFQIEVLSESPISSDLELEDIAYAIREGDCSGNVLAVEHGEVDGPTMARMLQGQGSDPEFFQLDAEGNDSET